MEASARVRVAAVAGWVAVGIFAAAIRADSCPPEGGSAFCGALRSGR
ncbi:MAG: hypothetical protein M0Z27_05985 [Thermaerobacter sp.]|nr:hypothetical protein [Thermaerobacter sp.]